MMTGQTQSPLSNLLNRFNFGRFRRTPQDLKLLITLWPSFDHFPIFANDNRLAGIRLNPAMITVEEVIQELELLEAHQTHVPFFYDVKGRQLRIEEVFTKSGDLVCTLNHPISAPTPTEVLFKAGADWAMLKRIEDNGRILVFDGGPEFNVKMGESIHILDPRHEVHGPLFTDYEMRKIEAVKKFGFKRFFLSFVESQRDIDEFLSIVGRDSEVWLKIENQKGLQFVANEFRKAENLVLVTARGDLYVELEFPHQVIAATRLIVNKDPQACVASRILLSIVQDPVPSCADFSELAWLYDIGYRRMMLCDDLCLTEEYLSNAIAIFDAFREQCTSQQLHHTSVNGRP